MKDGDVIKALGGFLEISHLLDVTVENARQMEKRRIPWKYRLRIQTLAKRKKVKLPADFLDVQRPT